MTDEPVAYLNGQYIPRSRLTIDAADAGFVYGATVTDFCRTYNQKLFRWDDHLQRLRRDCEVCHIPLVETDAELSAIAEELLERNPANGQERAIITFATPGLLPGRSTTSDTRPTLGMQTLSLEAKRYQHFFDNGVSLEYPHLRLPMFLPNVKHRNRLSWWLAAANCQTNDSVAILFDPDNKNVDTAIGGVVAVNRDGEVVVSKPGTVLDSISIRVVTELCQSLKLPIRFDLQPKQFGDHSSETMLAGTGFGLAGVRELRTKYETIPYVWPGPVTLRLQRAWSELVGCDITVIPDPS